MFGISLIRTLQKLNDFTMIKNRNENIHESCNVITKYEGIGI